MSQTGEIPMTYKQCSWCFLIARSYSFCSFKQSIETEIRGEAMEVATNEMISAALSDSANRAPPRAHDCSFCFIRRCLGSWQVTDITQNILLNMFEYYWYMYILLYTYSLYWYVVANCGDSYGQYFWKLCRLVVTSTRCSLNCWEGLDFGFTFQ